MRHGWLVLAVVLAATASAADWPMRAIVRELHDVATDREIRIDLKAIIPGKPPLLCGVEISFEDRGP